jgi:AcrR family transcriptional regulator
MDRILNTAARLFRERGIAGASMRGIAQESGVLLGSLTYRYPKKSDLLLAVMDAGVQRAVLAIEDVVEGTDAPLVRLQLALRVHLNELLAPDSAVWLLLNEWGRLPPESRDELREVHHRYERVWKRLVEDASVAGQLSPGLDLRLVHLFVFGAANSVAHWYQPDGGRTPNQIADAFSAFIGVGVLSDSARPASAAAMLESMGATLETTDE